jgi:hypothetical protein
MITLNLEINELNGVLTGLSQLPYGQVADLIAKIRVQATPQVQAQSVPQQPTEAQ